MLVSGRVRLCFIFDDFWYDDSLDRSVMPKDFVFMGIFSSLVCGGRIPSFGHIHDVNSLKGACQQKYICKVFDEFQKLWLSRNLASTVVTKNCPAPT